MQSIWQRKGQPINGQSDSWLAFLCHSTHENKKGINLCEIILDDSFVVFMKLLVEAFPFFAVVLVVVATGRLELGGRKGLYRRFLVRVRMPPVMEGDEREQRGPPALDIRSSILRTDRRRKNANDGGIGDGGLDGGLVSWWWGREGTRGWWMLPRRSVEYNACAGRVRRALLYRWRNI